MFAIGGREDRLVPIDIEVCIAWSFGEAAFGHVDSRDSIGVTDINFDGRDTDEGAVLLMKMMDSSSFVADIGVVV